MSAEEPKLETPPEPAPSQPAAGGPGEALPASAEESGPDTAPEPPPAPPPSAGPGEPVPMSAEEPWPEEPRPEAAPPSEPPSAAGEVGEPASAEIPGMDDAAADETPPEPVSAAELHMPAEPSESAPAPRDLDEPLAVSGEVPSLSAEPHEVEQAPSALTSADFGARVEMGVADFGTSDEAPTFDAPPDPAPDAPADDDGSVPMSADDLTTTSEAPKFEAPPEPPPPAPPPAAERAAPAPPPPAPPRVSAPPAPAKRGSAVPVIAAAVVVALALGGFLLARSGLLSGAPVEDAYTVAAYTPPQALVSARERVLAYAQPNASSPIVVMFGAGAELDVQGRVSLGLGNDWYQIAWNGQTAFVRQQDAVPGGEAPPGIAERAEPEEEEEVKPGEDEKPETVAMAEFPPLPPAQFDLSSVRWIREPNARDFARFYPERALDQGRSGRVVLDCVVGGNGRLDCSVAEENPPGWGFGAAAVSIARQTRIDPTGPDGRSVAGEHLRLPLAFRASSD